MHPTAQAYTNSHHPKMQMDCPGPCAPSALAGAMDRVDRLRKFVSELEGIADRACGPVPEEPNGCGMAGGGLLEELQNSLDRLEYKLREVTARLSQIA